MYQVTYIGPNKLETKTFNQEGLEAMTRNLKMELFNLLRGREPCFVVKEIKEKKSREPVSCAG